MTIKKLPTKLEASSRDVANAILNLVGKIPKSSKRISATPNDAARELANASAAKAALISGGLALPPGPLGLLTILPDLIAIWCWRRPKIDQFLRVVPDEN